MLGWTVQNILSVTDWQAYDVVILTFDLRHEKCAVSYICVSQGNIFTEFELSATFRF